VIAVTGPCYLNMITVLSPAGAEGWAEIRDTTSTSDLEDVSIKDVKDSAADRATPFKYGDCDDGMFLSKGLSIHTGNTATVFVGVTRIGGQATANPRT